MQVLWLLPRHRALNRVWLGLCLGLLEMMWFPALCAFALRFSMAAHGAAAGVLANVGQGAVGLVIALVLMALLKGSKALDKLAVQW